MHTIGWPKVYPGLNVLDAAGRMSVTSASATVERRLEICGLTIGYEAYLTDYIRGILDVNRTVGCILRDTTRRDVARRWCCSVSYLLVIMK